ncbi:hypothetical protein NEMIN01_1135 [Nematocida minor]|uniref:uncharacterized protein n=1 Tax=Nematocida minor TaxID=1912983 RepID=UPI0022212A9D|nr:uncharacterized protein NEMIN01_1135 [Nematocida minor]KAI5190670.1 hypothetical protein NEMIN01_1135 [Nematocida minor]
MECRRISNTILCMGYSSSELKRNQYVTIINCRLSGKEEEVSSVCRIIKDKRSYYSVITDSNTIHWFNVASTSSFIKAYPVVVNNTYTNILQFLEKDSTAAYSNNAINGNDVSASGNSVSNQSATGNAAINENAVSTNGNASANSNNSEGASYTLNSKSIVLFNDLYTIVEVPGSILLYSHDGQLSSSIDTGIDRVTMIYPTLCNKYLFIAFEKGMISLYDLTNSQFLYRKRHPVGRSFVFGSVFQYLRYYSVAKNTLAIGRVSDGQILIELSYPEEITNVATDVLNRQITVSSVSGKIFYSRLDNEQSAFTECKVTNDEIKSVSFSVSGRYIFVASNLNIFIIDSKDGKIIKTILSNSLNYFSTFTSSSNLHLK